MSPWSGIGSINSGANHQPIRSISTATAANRIRPCALNPTHGRRTGMPSGHMKFQSASYADSGKPADR